MKSFITLATSFFLSSCFNNTDIKGRWSLELQIQKQAIPFILEFKSNNKVTLYNGKEEINLNYETNDNSKDIKIDILNYDAAIVLSKMGNTLKGNWIKYNRSPEYKVPIFGMKQLSKKHSDFKKINSLPKKWEMSIGSKNKKQAILLFTQEQELTYASILTQTGDYRYLTPSLEGKKLKLYGFDGVFAFLLSGEISKSGLYSGDIYSGKSWNESFSANENDNFELKDPESITSYKGDFSKLELKDLNGKPYKLGVKSDNVRVLQIFGSWCPNCIDETKFITKWIENNKNKAVDFYMLAFERSPNKIHAKKQIKKVKKLFNINYPILIGGFTTQDKVATVLPGLENFISFPTTIFIDKLGKIRKIHAGFNGPATGKYYERFTDNFDRFINDLLME